MTRGEYERKLGNAVRDYKGRRTTDGRWFRRPNPSAKARVERWIWRCRQAGMSIPAKVEAEMLAPLGEHVPPPPKPKPALAVPNIPFGPPGRYKVVEVDLFPDNSAATEKSEISKQPVLTEQPH